MYLYSHLLILYIWSNVLRFGLCSLLPVHEFSKNPLDSFRIQHNRTGFINTNNDRTYLNRRKESLRRYNVAPPGSRIAFEMERFKIDPLNTSPWEYEVAIVDSIEKERNLSYRFLKNDWGYLDHSDDPNQPSGVIEGGPENYEGKGLQLPKGRDRIRTEYFPYHMDHGVQYRQRVRSGSISFDIAPMANQDVTPFDTDLELERRQWGSWHQPTLSAMCTMPSIFRSHIRIENTTELPYHWLDRFNVFQRIPLHRERPSTIIPLPDPDWRFAALNCYTGIMDKPREFQSTEESLVSQKKLLKEWTRLEKQYKKTRDPNILEEIKHVKFALFGIPDFSDSEDEMLKLVTEAAMIRARMMLQLQADDRRKDPETIEHFITRVNKGEINPTSCYDGPERTIVLNLVNYKPMSKKFRLHTTIEEMAETYHTLITENRREGRVHTRTAMTPAKEYKEYPLRKYRKQFPALDAQYRPIWANKGYGSEFGDAIRESQKIPEDELTDYGRPLNRRKRKFTKDVFCPFNTIL